MMREAWRRFWCHLRHGHLPCTVAEPRESMQDLRRLLVAFVTCARCGATRYVALDVTMANGSELSDHKIAMAEACERDVRRFVVGW